MGKPGRNPQLPLVLSRQQLTLPLTQCCGLTSKIHYHIKDFSGDCTNQLPLSMRNLLLVEASEHSSLRLGVVVLNKVGCLTGLLCKVFFVKALKEKTTINPKNSGFQDQKIRKLGLSHFHNIYRSLINPSKYCPYSFFKRG